MKLITPRDTTDVTLLSSSIVENDHPQWQSAFSYARGDFVISLTTHTVYRSLTDGNNNNDPDIEQAALADPLIDDPDPINWQVIGATNRWRMFDKKPSVQATAPDQIQVVLEPGRIIGGLAGFNIDANTVTIDVQSPGIARRNLLTFTEQFDNAAWVKQQVSVQSNSSTAPDGTLTAENVVPDTTNTGKQLARAPSVTSGLTYTFSYYAKANGYSFCGLIFAAVGFGTNMVDVFDLANGTVAVNQSGTASIVAVGNGWYRVSGTRTATASSAATFQIRIHNTGVAGNLFTGDGTSGVLIWGAQLEEGSLTDYQAVDPRFQRNLATWTQALDNPAWTKFELSVVPNVVAAPDGTITGSRLVPSTQIQSHEVSRAFSGIPANTIVCITLFARPEAFTGIRLFTDSAQGWDFIRAVEFGLEGEGVIADEGLSFFVRPPVIARRPDGWYRCQAFFRTSGVVENRTVRIQVLKENSSSQSGYIFNFPGDGVSGVLFGGIQVETGNGTAYQRIDADATQLYDQTVYHKVIPMQDQSVVTDWYSYYFAPLTPLTEFVITDYPLYGDSQLTLTFDQLGDTVGVGQIALGDLRQFGTTLVNNSGFTGLDFSLVQQDEFGDLTTVRRAATRISEFEVFFENSTLLGFDTVMRGLRGGVAAVWVGDEDTRKAAINYGFYRDYRTVYRTSEFSIVSLQIQGIV